MPSTKEIYDTITPKATRTRIILLIVFGIALLVIIALYILLHNSENITYTTIKPIQGNITQSVSATGTLSPTNEVEVGSQISGTIYKLHVDVNDSVRKDQILAEINPNKLNQTKDGYEAQLQSGLANLEASKVAMEQKKWNYEQQQQLYEATNGRTPSKLELQTAKMDYLSAKADVKIKQASIAQIQTNLKSAKIDLQNAIIKSPIDGIILERSISLGQTVAASFQTPTLFKLAQNLKEMNLVVNISESDIGKVQSGQNVSFSVDAYPNQTFQAKVDRVNFAATTTDNITSYETTIYVQNENLLLKPGMNATAFIQVASEKDALLVPVAAIFYDPQSQKAKPDSKKPSNPLMFSPPPRRQQQTHAAINTNNARQGTIWVLEKGVPTAMPVTIGISDSKMVAIKGDNLSLNTEIIIDSH
ncbi:efflux RND transporter periplasmic adaptor subunit [Helicobacter trogontum]|uniref:Efflux RND transporter periplasmic adaptor subunit n=1 Tax=Helicobacter trogontum TaxID=50960 RepID=A0ABQ0D5E3_9HELI|nr:efflux RND transporter periplasmic adaptor subunit [Helicobacter trogontum]